MSPKQRMEELLVYLQESPNGLATKIGIHPTNIYHIINERNKTISDKLAYLISSKFSEINPDWLTKGRGTMVESVEEIKTIVEGIPLAEEDYEYGEIVISNNPSKYILPGANKGFVIKVRDDSMVPDYKPGDIVSAHYIDVNDIKEPLIWGKNYIVTTGKVGFIRQLMPGKNDHIKMVAINKKYPDFELNKEAITNIAKITTVTHLE